jgi:hypothetical protein
MPKINEIYAYIQADQGPDDEGVIAAKLGGTWMPLIGADVARKDALKIAAQNTANITKKPVKLVKFSVREEIEVFTPI